jgi:ferric-dicitrate binding protein FerR (iron transport regulator)
LDEAEVGELDNIGGIVVNKQADGILSIEVINADVNAPIGMNTIRTPAGGQYQIKLPDGTKVWLNASSIIKFPSSFARNFREVELEGEAYFEVAKMLYNNNINIHFFVKNKEQQIEVLGTHFNVSSYPEDIIKTTLLEGSVRVYSLISNSSQVLKPGQQSQIVNGEIEIRAADTESSFAWKNGDFIFNNEELYSIMNKLERWYDIEVEYKGSVVPRRFSGAVSRSNNLSEVLRIMELTGKVKFEIEGRRVFVMM